MLSEELIAADLAAATAGLRSDGGCCPESSSGFGDVNAELPSPEAMSAQISQALEAEFLSSGPEATAGSDQLLSALLQLLDQNPGLKITLSK